MEVFKTLKIGELANNKGMVPKGKLGNLLELRNWASKVWKEGAPTKGLRITLLKFGEALKEVQLRRPTPKELFPWGKK